MTSERGVFLAATRDFEVTVADTPAAIEAAHRLRRQVEQDDERGAAATAPDRFDARAEHVLLRQCSMGDQVVGTVRVVAPSSEGVDAGLPMQELCGPGVFRALPRASTGEIGRFVISRGFNDVDCTGSAPLRLGLLKGVVQVSAQLGLAHWCALMEHTLLRFLHGSAVQFQPLGPTIEHGGRLCQPTWAGIDVLLTRLRGERPALWDYLTEGGSLWREAAVEVAAA